ncbi:MAG: hypothetical protein M3R62_10620 [Acidobacteriota bacterium]|nr:hypothetical protein [Acidobacteriota bacterium]
MKAQMQTCHRARAALRDGAMTPTEESHLFVCGPCRKEARLAAAWKSLPPLEEVEAAPRVDESFVRGVLARVREDRQRRARNRIGLAAAAALLFFFAAGASQQAAATGIAGAEESYAQMLTPSLDSILPE